MNKEILEEFNKKTGGMFTEMIDKSNKGLCPSCGKIPGPFKDALSRREFAITGFCQKCQDELEAMSSEENDDMPFV